MTIRTLRAERRISGGELAFRLQPVISREPNPTKILSDDVWGLVDSLLIVAPDFEGIVDHVTMNPGEWTMYLNSPTPETEVIPYSRKLSSFQRLLLLLQWSSIAT
jgi:hypothetical protein